MRTVPRAGEADPAISAEWAAKAVDAVDLAVSTVTDKAVRPVLLAARAVVFGVIVATMATAGVVLGSIGLVRLLVVYAFGPRVWAAYLLLGSLLTATGLVLWWQRAARPAAGAD